MKIIAVLLASLMMSGCSFEQVPPAHKGKILSTSGYKPELLPPGKVTLWGRDKLILLETGVATFKEPMTVLMSDRLELKFDVRGRVRMAGDKKTVHAMFNDITHDKNGKVTLKKVYETYGKMLVRNKGREVVGSRSIDDVHTSYKDLSAELYKVLQEAFKGTPLVVSDVALGNIKFPDVVTNAVAAQKEREIAIGREKAQVEIDLTKKRGEQQLAEADRQIRLIKAQTIRDENRTVAEAVTPEYLSYKRLEVMEKMAESGSAVFMPFDAMGNPGAQMRMFQAQ